jgi:hypothetical protein
MPVPGGSATSLRALVSPGCKAAHLTPGDGTAAHGAMLGIMSCRALMFLCSKAKTANIRLLGKIVHTATPGEGVKLTYAVL